MKNIAEYKTLYKKKLEAHRLSGNHDIFNYTDDDEFGILIETVAEMIKDSLEISGPEVSVAQKSTGTTETDYKKAV